MSKKEKEIEFPTEYRHIAHSIINNADENQKKVVEKILFESPKALETYQVLKDEKVPKRMIYDAMSHGLQDLGSGRSISASAYAFAIAKRLQRIENYPSIIQEMYDDHIISESQYENLADKTKHEFKKTIRHASSGLEKLALKAAAAIMIILGVIIILASGLTTTAAAIGVSTTQIPFTFFVGLILFTIGLVIFPRE